MNAREQYLFEGYIDQSLNKDELCELKAALQASPEFAQNLADTLHLHGLGQTINHCQFGELTEQIQRSIAEFQPTKQEDKILRSIQENPKSAHHRFFPYWTLAIAAQLTIILGVIFWITFQPGTNIAEVTRAKGSNFIVRGEEKILLKTGIILQNEDQIFVETNSHVTFRYFDNSEIYLSDNSYIKLANENGAKHIHFFAGVIHGDIQKQPPNRPMKVITADSMATVLGTRFEMNSSDMSTLLKVTEGQVRLEQPEDHVVTNVDADEFAISKQEEGIHINTVGSPIFRSNLITANTPGHAVDIEVDVRKAKKLYLVTANGGINGNRYDHVVWLDPRLLGATIEDLTQHEWILAKSGYKSSRINKGLFGGPIRVNGEIHKRGISTHATSVIAYNIPEGTHTFSCRAALLDSGLDQPESVSSVSFEIYTELPKEQLQKLLIRKQFY